MLKENLLKNTFGVLFISLFLTSCAVNKVATVSSDNLQLVKNGLVFENDTLKITYKFWAKNGAMTFDIYNKTNLPLFFDWKKSAFIPNDKMMSYWQDETNTEGNSKSSAYYLNGGVAAASSRSKSKSIRQERVGVVPPRSLITSNKYSLVLPSQNFVTDITYNNNNSPLRFRNYLAVSSTEQFDKDVFYVDNSFFVTIVKKVKEKNLKAAQFDNSFFITNK